MRAFIALELPEAVRDQLRPVINYLRANLHDNVKWVKPENLHITLKFLGEVDSARLTELARELDFVLAQWPAFELGWQAWGAFPHKKRPQVVWLGLNGQAAQLSRLAGEVDRAAVAAGFAPEQRLFSPHLTLARIRHPQPQIGQDLEQAFNILEPLPDGLAKMRKLSIMQSVLSPQGAAYRPLQSWTLEG